MSLHAVIAGWLLAKPSGANTRLLALLRHIGPLLGHGERVTVLHRANFAPPRLHPSIQFQAIAIPAAPTFRRALAERRLLGNALRSLGASVLDHGFLPVPFVPCPVVLTIHDLRDADGHGRSAKQLSRWLLRRSLARVHTVLVPSLFTKAQLLEQAPGTRIVVAPNGVTMPECAALPHEDGYLLHVGHLERRKNLAVLLYALAMLPMSARPNLRLIGADAGAQNSLRALTKKLGLVANVQFLGVVDDAEVTRQYAAARAVVVPSHYEGFGLAALDGLANGKPVLVSAAGALPELVCKSGIVLPPDDARAWASAIAALPAPTAEATQKRRARASSFAWPRTAELVLAAWRTAATHPH
jgi:glycosyltransferase involved in cell wall biosynthesis